MTFFFESTNLNTRTIKFEIEKVGGGCNTRIPFTFVRTSSGSSISLFSIYVYEYNLQVHHQPPPLPLYCIRSFNTSSITRLDEFVYYQRSTNNWIEITTPYCNSHVSPAPRSPLPLPAVVLFCSRIPRQKRRLGVSNFLHKSVAQCYRYRY